MSARAREHGCVCARARRVRVWECGCVCVRARACGRAGACRPSHVGGGMVVLQHKIIIIIIIITIIIIIIINACARVVTSAVKA